MNFHSISLVFTLKTIVEEQICAINEVIGYTWAIAQFPQSGKQETPSYFYFQMYYTTLYNHSPIFTFMYNFYFLPTHLMIILYMF